jgi:hypothetical protein
MVIGIRHLHSSRYNDSPQTAPGCEDPNDIENDALPRGIVCKTLLALAYDNGLPTQRANRIRQLGFLLHFEVELFVQSSSES